LVLATSLSEGVACEARVATWELVLIWLLIKANAACRACCLPTGAEKAKVVAQHSNTKNVKIFLIFNLLV